MRKEEVFEFVKERFPLVPLEKIEYNAGYDFGVFLIDKKSVIRFPFYDNSISLLKNEVAVLRTVSSRITAAHIPQYTWIADDWRAAESLYVAGEPVTQEQLEQKGDCVRKLAQFLTELHTVPTSPLTKELEVRSFEEKIRTIEKNLERVTYSKLNKEEIDQIKLSFKEAYTLSDSSQQNTLVHGDLHENHVLWDEENKSLGIIDFSDVIITDPATDFASLHVFGDEVVQNIYESYNGPKDDKFLERARIHFKCIPLYMMTTSERAFDAGYPLFKERFSV